MNITSHKLTRASMLHADLLKLINIITEIKKVMAAPLNANCHNNFNLFIEEIATPQPEPKSHPDPQMVIPVNFPDGSCHLMQMYRREHVIPEQTTIPHIIKFSLSDSNTIRVLAILLEEKEQQRQQILAELETLLGPDINIIFPESNPIHERYAE